MNILQIALLGNGIFSISTGLYLLFFRNRVAQWFGREKSLIYLVIGFGLLYFSYSIFRQLKNPQPEAVLYIIVQDFIWVLVSFILLFFKLLDISALGYKIITGVAFIVLLFGIVQSIGLARTDDVGDKRMKRLSFERKVNATKENVWEVISDVSNYHRVAPNIDSVEIISGEGQGMIRNCTHGTASWTEVATLWEEGEQYSFQANTDAKDYPYPLTYLKGTWKVKEIAKNQTKIIMTFDFTYKRKVHNLLIHPFMKKKFDEICEELLDNWQERLELK
ncbi:MAG: SRPBCC family protein [Bacteroidota bacterium]